jgi:2-oxoglutarate dehydrogenase E1 component
MASERSPEGVPGLVPGQGTQRASLAVNGWSSDYVDGLYLQWKEDRNAVPVEWAEFFAGFDLGATRVPAKGAAAATPAGTAVEHSLQRKVDRLIDTYRRHGHLAAHLDPLGTVRPFPDCLTLEAFGLGDGNLNESFDAGDLPIDSPAKLSTILETLERTYCGPIGIEYMAIADDHRRRWLQKRIETVAGRPPMTAELRKRLLGRMCDAETLEQFLDKRFVGKKRFGVEGNETLVPFVDQLVENAPANGIKEIDIGMAHRGRLNILVHILGKTIEQVVTEFDESWAEDFADGGGDVKYHSGHSADRPTSSGATVRMTLASNPSHLEFVDPVVMGRVRAKQDLMGDADRSQVVPLVLHGDAAMIGQGVVPECINLVRLAGYQVGGTIHLTVNNQVGFTTEPHEGRSGPYSTDWAKAVDAPVFHVNSEDVEGAAWVARLALEYRQAFKEDVFVDLIGWRKAGHNETDEPFFTQPTMYKAIRAAKTLPERYRDRLVEAGLVTVDEYAKMRAERLARMDEAQARAKDKPVHPRVPAFQGLWAGISPSYSADAVETGVPRARLDQILKTIGTPPEGFHVHKVVAKLMQSRVEMAGHDDALVDWATAELLAYGSLLLEGHRVRLTGQDVRRGTFSHRHAVVRDQETGERHFPLEHLGANQAAFEIHNSPLTECACMGFEYGYALTDPGALVLWEAQFGDFANGAQVIIDQFIASGEIKWRRANALTLLLPHGYEGQGPEHSSARLERYLQLCADDNIQVCYPTTSSQVFHLLRRQVTQKFRKPLVVMTPKSMLRLPAAQSRLRELVGGQFRTVLPDPMFAAGQEGAHDPASVTRVVLCTGKIAHELMERRAKAEVKNVAVVRLEQLYPFPDATLAKVLAAFPKAERFVWAQEEARNMGAFRFVETIAREQMGLALEYAGRRDSASPSTGSLKVHTEQQERIVNDALAAGGKASSPKPAAKGGKSSDPG